MKPRPVEECEYCDERKNNANFKYHICSGSMVQTKIDNAYERGKFALHEELRKKAIKHRNTYKKTDDGESWGYHAMNDFINGYFTL